METRTGWIQREAQRRWRTFGKPGIHMDECMSLNMLVTIVSVPTRLHYIPIHATKLAVYLDNPTAVNDLLIKELNKRVK